MGERIPIVGTPYTINYRSDRVPGRLDDSRLEISLIGDEVPEDLLRIELSLQIAGRVFKETFPAASKQEMSFVWDGMDAYGRRLQGSHDVKITISYIYPAYYGVPASYAASFGLSCQGPPDVFPPALLSCVVPSNVNGSARQEVSRQQQWVEALRGPTIINPDLNAWSLNIHHHYDIRSKRLYKGDGSRRSAEAVALVINTVAGNGSDGYSGDGGLATEAQLDYPFNVIVAPDGSLYIADYRNHRIRRVDSDGMITTVVGNGSPGYGGDGGLATEAQLEGPYGMAFGPDGSLYISDALNDRVRRVGVDGMITTVAGNEPATTVPWEADSFSGDGGLATEAQLNYPLGIALASDGTLYITDSFHSRIRRVDSDGIINTVAGEGIWNSEHGDGGLATEARLHYPSDVKIAPDGSLYIADYRNYRIRRVDLEGFINTVAGSSPDDNWSTALLLSNGDGAPADEASLVWPYSLAFAPDGSFYIGDVSYLSGQQGVPEIRRVDPRGIITTVAGRGPLGYSGDGGLALEAQLGRPSGIAVAPDGSLYIADSPNHRIRRVQSILPNFSTHEISIPSQDGREIYRFSAEGRHLETIDTLSSVVKYAFNYDGSGYLASVIDSNGQVTVIERDGNGAAEAIVGPFGHRTELSMDANAYLASLENPLGEIHSFTYSEEGLLESMTTPRNFTYTFEYDELGRLLQDTDPLGGYTQLNRVFSEISDAYTVTKTTAMGRVTSYHVENLPESELGRQWVNTAPDGTETMTIYSSGSQVMTLPDGTELRSTQRPDSRFGMQSPLPETTITLPNGQINTVVTREESVLEDSNDLLSLISKTAYTCVNGSGDVCFGGRLNISDYDAATRQQVFTSAEGRQITLSYDEQDRLVSSEIAGLAPMYLSYNEVGQLENLTVGEGAEARTQSFSYGADGNVSSLSDALEQVSFFSYDSVGRLSQMALPDGQVLQSSYDASGNLSGLMPPGRETHHFEYNGVNLIDLYTPPLVGGGSGILDYDYNLDKQVTQISRSDGSSIVYQYDGFGRLGSLDIARGSLIYQYNANGKIELIDTPQVDLSFAYNGPLITDLAWSEGINGSVTWTYSDYLEPASQSINGADTINYTYDNDGLITSVGGFNLIYDAQHALLTNTHLLNISTSQSYNSFGELSIYTATFDNGLPVDFYQEEITARDNLGRMLSRQEAIEGSSQTDTYEYHGQRGWLANVYRDGVQIAHYEYDSNGNRVLYQNPNTGEEIAASYDGQDRLQSYGDYTYSYTANGELQQRENTVSGEVTSYVYDELGNLVSVTLADSTLIEYLIDGQSRRVGKRVNGVLTQGFLYQDQLNPVAELDDAGDVLSRFVYASKDHVPDYMVREGNAYRIITDHLGSVRLVVNADSGVIEQRMDYDVFGQVTQDTNPGFQPFGFAGGIYDGQTGLVRFGARDYDAQIGRWTAKDPIGFEGEETSLYAYVGNDPVNFIDPSGLVNQVKRVVGIINLARAGKGYLGAIGKFGKALFKIVYLSQPLTRAAWATLGGLLDLNSALDFEEVGRQQILEALSENSCDASWINLLGLLPEGHHYDDPHEVERLLGQFYSNTDRINRWLKRMATRGF